MGSIHVLNYTDQQHMTIDNRVVFGPPFGGKKQVRTDVRYTPIRG